MAKKKRINLALQGGGAHGAFTWGVLDRLLEEEEIEIASISGTSAGALNGAALKAGLAMGSREAAKDNLDWLWDQVAGLQDLDAAEWMAALWPWPGVVSKSVELSPLYVAGDIFSRMFSPYGYGPLYKNPLERIAREFHYDKVCDDHGPLFFVCATSVRSGKIRVFSGSEISTEVIMASACLPTLFQAVEFVDPATGEEEAFWDGGYTGNPALFPMFRPELPEDILIVNINPLYREKVPQTPQEIQNRINEISFNSSLFRELRAISFVKELHKKKAIKPGEMKDVHIHMIADDGLMTDLSVATKVVPIGYILSTLKKAGRAATEAFLADHKSDLNKRSSVDVQAMFS
jgi:NTE family protein